MPPASTIMMAISPFTSRPATTIGKVESSCSSKVGYGIHSPSVEYARRTPPMGPSKGRPVSISDAEAALMAITS